MIITNYKHRDVKPGECFDYHKITNSELERSLAKNALEAVLQSVIAKHGGSLFLVTARLDLSFDVVVIDEPEFSLAGELEISG